MADQTPRLKLPFMNTAQVNKELTFNELAAMTDTLVGLTVLDKDLNIPPALPADGAAYIVGPAPTGVWAGKPNYIAFWTGGWHFIAPSAGFIPWVEDESIHYRYKPSTTSWVSVTIVGVSRFVDLLDVAVAPGAPTNGYAIIWNDTLAKFTLQRVASSVLTLSDYDNTTAPTAGQAMVYDAVAAKWKPGAVAVSSGNRGAWSATPPAPYAFGDVVTKLGRYWLCVVNATAASPVIGSANWIVIGTVKLEALADVDVTTTLPTAGQALVFDNADSKWKPGTIAGGGGGGGGGPITNRGPWGEGVGGTKTFPTVGAFAMPGTWTNNHTMEVIADIDAGPGTTNALTFTGGGLGGGANAQLNIAFTTVTPGPFTIRFKTQGEYGYDGTTLQFDGVDVLTRRVVDTVYYEHTQAMAAGNHTFQLRYTSDGGISGGYQNVRISEIIIPAAGAVPYIIGDVVTHLGRYWECLATGTSAAPSIAGIDWVVIGTVKLQQLADVDVSTPPTDGQALVFDTALGKWKPGTIAGGGGGGGASNVVAKAMVKCSAAGVLTIVGGTNITSIVETPSAGRYTVTFTSPIPADCVMLGSARFGDNSSDDAMFVGVSRRPGEGILTATAHLLVQYQANGGMYSPNDGGRVNGWFYFQIIDPTI